MKISALGVFASMVYAASAQTTTIYQTAEGAGLSTLVTAVDTADLTDTLNDTSADFTVFAPTNQAFVDTVGAKLGHLLVNDTYSKQLLTDVLLAHVVPGGKTAAQLGASETTVNQEKLTIELPAITTGFPNTASVTATSDVAALATSIIHVIDKVLLPTGFPVNTIAETATGAGLATLVAALTEAGLVPTFSEPQENTWTVFAPTEEAFADLLAALQITAQDLLASPKLGLVLSAHAAKGSILAANLPTIIDTLQGKIAAGDIQVNTTDIKNINGIVHTINEVIVPTVVTAAVNNGFDSLVQFVGAAGLVPTLADPTGTFTVFVPTDEAFDAVSSVTRFLAAENTYANGLLNEILTYHVLGDEKKSDALGASETTLEGSDITLSSSDGKVFVNGDSEVIVADLEQFNGVVHAINKVLIPPNFPTKSIATIASETEALSTLVAALVEEQSILNAASNPGVFTVFAPTNEAFANLLAALNVTAAKLLSSPQLGDVLRAHVMPAAVFSGDVPASGNIATLYGDIPVSKLNLTATLDVKALNGVVHVVNEVIVPDGLTVTFPDDNTSPSASSTTVQSILLVVSTMAVFMF